MPMESTSVLPNLASTGDMNLLKTELEQTRLKSNWALLNVIRMEDGMEQSRRSALQRAGSLSERKRLNGVHNIQREAARKHVLTEALKAEMALIDKMRSMGIRSPVGLIDAFPHLPGHT